ncbi:MAG: hypothetical protein DRP89_03035 [Candidatus Neomarinimicrobiota bacterium]|nr:MAG: hypothetical protein DRP89_03035 [Candidatus Neomarinimicrobiota bacterium]
MLYMIFILLPICIFSQSQSRLPFQVGEEITYSVWFNFIKAGKSTMNTVCIDTIDGAPTFHAVLKTQSLSVLDKIYKVRDNIESWVDVEGLFSRKFKKKIREGLYKKKYSVRFDYDDSLAYSSSDTIPISGPVHDALSIFYYVRAESLWVGKIFDLNNFDNNKFKPYKVIVRKLKIVKTDAGEFECFVLEPYAEKGNLFKYKGQLTIYLSNDVRRLPVKVESEATIGSMIMKIESYKYK